MKVKLNIEKRGSQNYKFTMQSRDGRVLAALCLKNGLLNNFIVHPSYRKKGLGKQLFRAALNYPETPKNLRLTARPYQDKNPIPMDKLEKFYAYFGFVAVERTPISIIMESRSTF